MLLFLVLWVGVAHAAVTHIPIKSGVVLKPGEVHIITVQATTPVEIGWLAVQAKRCTMNCVQATDLTSSMQYSIATSLGASKEYHPYPARSQSNTRTYPANPSPSTFTGSNGLVRRKPASSFLQVRKAAGSYSRWTSSGLLSPARMGLTP
jgi:hypothetical protein